MADKKITALTDMAAIGKSPAEDLLHIIDYGGGSSPVNKKITIANLFSKVNTSTQIYAASSEFEIGLTDATVSVLKAFVGASATAASGVIINEDQNDLTDFTVKTQNFTPLNAQFYAESENPLYFHQKPIFELATAKT